MKCNLSTFICLVAHKKGRYCKRENENVLVWEAFVTNIFYYRSLVQIRVLAWVYTTIFVILPLVIFFFNILINLQQALQTFIFIKKRKLIDEKKLVP